MTMTGKTRRLVFLTLCSTFALSALYAQERINDKDLEHLMRNMRDDAKSFRPPFTSAIKKSAIRKTSQAKDAENLALLFETQSESLLNNFKRTQKGDESLTAVQGSGQQLGAIVSRYQLGGQVETRWEKIQSELGQVMSAYGMSPSGSAYENPRGITPTGTSDAGACTQAVGQERASRLFQ